MKLEVIATSLRDAVMAQKSGADRLEIVSAIREGGLTPSYGLIREVVNATDIPVHVMVRPHSYSFTYTDEDKKVMLHDMNMIRGIGAAGIVIGALTDKGEIDTNFLQEAVDAAGSLNITFHRAFDELKDQLKGLQVLKQFPEITHILTSGGKPKAPDATETFKELLKESEGTNMTILAGSGLDVENVEAFLTTTHVQEVHVGSGVRFDHDYQKDIDGKKIDAIKGIFQNVANSK